MVMKFLTYTKYIWRKIKFYDRLAPMANPFMANPFNDKPQAVTVMWFDNNDDGEIYKS